MTNRSLRFAASLLALAGLAACSESRTIDMDAGPGDAGGELDAGTDTGPPPIDSGTPDAPPAPVDAWMRPDGSLLPPADAGDPFGDAGPLGPPAWVEIEVLTDSTCEPLVPCGGDVVGTWDVQGGCVEVPVPERLMKCPGATVTGTGRARGRVTFDGTTAVRIAQSEAEVEVFVPGLCVMFVPGGCPAIQTELRMQVPDSVCIEEAGGDCTCAARVTNTIDDTDGYTIEGNEIVGATSGKRWAYCVDGDTGAMRYEDVSTSGEREPGIIRLTPRD